MGLTQAAPGHNGARVARGDTLQHRGLMHSQGEVLRPHEDRGLLVGPRARAWRKTTRLHCSWDPSHLLTALLPVPAYTAPAMGDGRQIAAQNQVQGGGEKRCWQSLNVITLISPVRASRSGTATPT